MRSENRRYVVACYLVALALFYVTVDKMFGTLFTLSNFSNSIPNTPDFVKISRVISAILSAVLFFTLFSHAKASSFMEEVFVELRKVNWPLPLKQNTWLPTVVVVIFVLICAAILGVFDYFWSVLLRWIPNLFT